MVAANLRAIVIEIPCHTTALQGRVSAAPRDLLPWADPYIACLVARLKAEILAERSAGRSDAAGDDLRGEAEPPLAPGDDFDPLDRPGFDVDFPEGLR